MRSEKYGGDKRLDLSRHADKAVKKLALEDVTSWDLQNMKERIGDSESEDYLRHLVLCERDAAITGQGNKQEASALTFTGILRTQKEARSFVHDFRTLPDNAVIILGPGSPKDRCQETQWIYEQEIRSEARRPESSFAVFEGEGFVSQDTLDRKGVGQAVVINYEKTDGIESEQAGPWSAEYFEDIKKMMSDGVYDKETPLMKIWVARGVEVDRVRKDIVKEGLMSINDAEAITPSLFRGKDNTPEARAKIFFQYVVEVLKAVQELYPDRPVYFRSFSHNMIMDAASLVLLGHEISRGSLRELADSEDADYVASRPLEGRSIRFENGRLIFSFRGREKEWTVDELNALVNEDGILDQKAEERFQEWQLKD